MKRFCLRAYHLLQRFMREIKILPDRWEAFGWEIALISFWDGLIPPGKSRKYISSVEKYVDNFLSDLVQKYQSDPILIKRKNVNDKLPIWCCWWQGEEKMPELVHLCFDRLKQIIPEEKASLHLITLENYVSYVDIPYHIQDKFQRGVITMTTMSDVLRFRLLEKYGGYWLDATVFFTGEIPEEYFKKKFYCQRMAAKGELNTREACRGNWCGFSMSGEAGNVIFRFMNEAFDIWWEKYDTIIDYVLIDYLLLTGYKYVPAIRATINSVPDNNQDIFSMYRVLNQPYSEELYQKLIQRNVMHKLTYKMELKKETENRELTIYGYLFRKVYGE